MNEFKKYFELMKNTRTFYNDCIIKNLEKNSEPLTEIFNAKCFETVFEKDIIQFFEENDFNLKFLENFNSIQFEKDFFNFLENEPNIKAITVENFKFYFDTKFFNEKDFQPIIQEKLNEIKIENPKTFKEILENPNNFTSNNEDDFPF